MLTVKNSILRSLKVIAASLLFVWLAWTFLIPGDEGNKVIAWGCFLLFSFTLIKGVCNLFDRRAKILIDANGIYFPGRKRSIIDWSEIKEFQIERNQYQDIIWIELQEGEPLQLKMFYLNIHPEELNKHVENCMMRAAGLPDRDELRKNAGKKGLAEFVGSALDDDSIDAEEPETAAEDFEYELNMLRKATSNEVAAKTTRNRALTDKSPDSEDADNSKELEDSEDSEDADELEEAEDPDASILAQAWHLPAWFSDEPVTNEIIWTGVLAGGLVAMLFGFAYLTGDPPKISVAEQIMVIVAFSVLAPFFLFMSSFFRGTSIHREWAGLDTKKSVSYSVKAKKRAAAAKPQKTGESPRKVRNKKHRR
ncbi:MAG TPA: STM3941 family protein [Candidatus Rifleibacterium sp.]|nr:STM3941 family protein [Candidatus Rifleibacterium sp.]